MRNYGEHFKKSFKDPNFKKSRTQCRYCQKEMADDVVIRQRHLARCIHLPKRVTRPCAKPVKRNPRPTCCYKCREKMSSQELKVHLSRCDLWNCTGCRKSILKSDKNAHLLVCPRVRCSRCLKSVSRPTYQAHFTACKFRYCSKCMFRTPSEEKLNAHRTNCSYKQCGRCGTKKIPKSELKAHYLNCNFQKCAQCGKGSIPNVKVDAHKAGCNFHKCRQCCRAIRVDEYMQHAKSCSFYRCYQCYKSRIPLQDMKAHLKVCEYRLCGSCHQKIQKDDLSHVCIKHRYGSLSRTQRQLRERLLNPKTIFPQTPSIGKIMNQWTKSPYTTIVLDFEYHSELLAEMKEESVFEIAIANALGKWIIPPTTINHQISTLDLSCKGWGVLETKYKILPLTDHTPTHRARAWRKWQSSIAKFYGQLSEDETTGLTWYEIALQLRTYTEVRNPLNQQSTF